MNMYEFLDTAFALILLPAQMALWVAGNITGTLVRAWLRGLSRGVRE